MVALAADVEHVVGADLRDLHDDGLDLAGEDVDAADLQHVVRAAHDLLHARVRAAALARLSGDLGQIARAVAQKRHGLLGQRGDDQFALLALVFRFQRLRIDDLGQEVVLGKVQPAAVLALAAHARADQFGHAVVVRGEEAEALFDLGAQFGGAALGAEQADAQFEIAGLVAQFRRQFAQIHGVGGRGDEGGDAKILHQHQLLFRIAGGGGHHRRAHALKTVVQPQRAGKKAIAKADLGDVLFGDAGGADDARHHTRPHVEIVLRIADHGGLAGGAGGGVYAHHLVRGHGKEAEGVIVAQIGLGGRRDEADIREGADMLGL